jgi:dihydroorotate dehydrogenase electron transfer subunit
LGTRGFVTDAIADNAAGFDYIYACGPLAMLRALHTQFPDCPGQYSFEERMGCGFGGCMGCTCKTKEGYKRICREGPVLDAGDIIW